MNTITSGRQARPGIGVDAAGTFVVAWENGSGRDGDERGIFAQRLDPSAAPLGDDIPVNTVTAGNQNRPAVTMAPGGTFVVAWADGFQSDGADGSGEGVFARRFDPSGMPQGDAFQVNTYTTGRQSDADVASDGAGRFVVTWSGQGPPDDGSLFGRRFDAAGAPLGDQFPLSAGDFGLAPKVAMNTAGTFAAAWASPDGDGDGVFARRFAPDGTPLGDAFPVNVHTAGNQDRPDVAVDDAGRVTVVWTDSAFGGDSPDGDGAGVFARRFAPDGMPLDDDFQVGAYTTGYQGNGRVAADGFGTFMVVWGDGLRDGSLGGIFGRHFDETGTPTGGDFAVNTYTFALQYAPAITASGDGDFLVAWSGLRYEDELPEVSARRFLEPCGNGVLDPGEDCDDGGREDGDCCSAFCTFQAGPCEDGDACTTDDTCVDGVCTATPACDDGDPCTTDEACVDGVCTADPACDDGDTCTTGDTCTAGACVGQLVGTAGFACRIDAVLAAPCGAEALPRRVERRIGKRLRRAGGLLEKAAGSTKLARQTRLQKRARKKLDAAAKVARKAAGARRERGRISAACQATLEAVVDELRPLTVP